MSFFKKLFGGGKSSKQPEPPEEHRAPLAKVPPPIDPSQDPNMIRVYDGYGRELFISKEEWRKNVLPGSIQTNWNKPDELYGVILGSLNDGFRSDVVRAAEQLYKIDPQHLRGACVWGIVLMEEDRLDAAEKVFRDYIARHGEDGTILTNLAKVYARRKDDAQADAILWHALEVDPNQENGVGWYFAIHRERGGDAAGEEALRRVAALPKSWRARLWLARTELQRRELPKALALYEEALAIAPQPPPTDLLIQMSGDLGNAAHLPELVNLTLPRFDVVQHGLQVGNNLIKALLDLGQIDRARQMLHQLYAQNRPDWKPTLSYWDTEIAKMNVATAPAVEARQLQVAMLTIEGPVWLKPESPAAELFPAKPAGAPTVALLGCTAEIATNSKRIEQQMSDAPGRMSRALPLFLAEQIEFATNARVQTLIPWITGASPGFVFSGGAWEDDAAAGYARSEAGLKSDYIVTLHLKPNAEPWSAELRLVRTIDARCLATLTGSFTNERLEQGIPDLARQLLLLLRTHAEVQLTTTPRLYQVPAAPHFGNYLLRLEQLLAVRCSGLDGVPAEFLSGEREIVDGILQLCLDYPQQAGVRILLAQTLLALKRCRPAMLAEYREKIALLQKEKPLPEPAHSVVQRLFNEAFAT